MKKIFFPLIFSALIAIVMTSCEKEPKHITENINVTLKKNQAYHYTLPSGESEEDPFEITTQASHYDISRLESNNRVYAYTPHIGYTGEDMVVIENENEEDGSCHRGGHGSCGNNDEEESGRTIIIHFTILDDNAGPVVTDHDFRTTICPSF